MAKRVYARGLNILGQAGQHNTHIVKQFTAMPFLDGRTVRTILCGFVQNYMLLGDGQIIQTGYVLDNLTSVRILNFYQKMPKAFLLYQKYAQPIMRNTLSFNNFSVEPQLLNANLIKSHNPQKLVAGGSHLVYLNNGIAYAMGDNIKGQLGDNSIRFGKEFKPMNCFENTIVDVACGFQHTILVTEQGSAYGCGKGSHNQISPYSDSKSTSRALKDFYMEPIPISKHLKIKQAAGGFIHTIMLSKDNKLYSLGSNKRGQCGVSTLRVEKTTNQIQEVYCYFAKDELIRDVKCGFHHTVVLTDSNAYFFGSVEHNQFPFPRLHNDDICTPTRIPIEGKPKKIFAGFDKTAIITEDNRCYLFGGADKTKYGGQSGRFQQVDLQISQNTEVGLGYMHTLIST